MLAGGLRATPAGVARRRARGRASAGHRPAEPFERWLAIPRNLARTCLAMRTGFFAGAGCHCEVSDVADESPTQRPESGFHHLFCRCTVDMELPWIVSLRNLGVHGWRLGNISGAPRRFLGSLRWREN